MQCARPVGIVDACICIDLCNSSLLDTLLLLPYQLIVPDVVAQQELKPTDLDRLLAIGACIGTASAQEVAMVDCLRQVHPRPSTYDLFVLAMAITRHAVLLSNDKHLRDAARREGLIPLGILGLLDMFETSVPGPRLAVALECILKGGARLPATECESRIRRWQQPP